MHSAGCASTGLSGLRYSISRRRRRDPILHGSLNFSSLFVPAPMTLHYSPPIHRAASRCGTDLPSPAAFRYIVCKNVVVVVACDRSRRSRLSAATGTPPCLFQLSARGDAAQLPPCVWNVENVTCSFDSFDPPISFPISADIVCLTANVTRFSQILAKQVAS